MGKAAFIVKDHKTFMNAEEARYKYCSGNDEALLFVVYPVGDPNNVIPTLRASIDPERWPHVEWVKTLSNYNPKSFKRLKKRIRLLDSMMGCLEYLFNFVDLRRLNRLARKYRPVKILFTVHRNMHEHLAARLAPDEAWLLDSGQTLDKITSSGYIDYRRSRYGTRFRQYMIRLLGFRIIDREDIGLFTVYADSADTGHRVEKNTQEYKRHLIHEKEIGEDVLFISSPFYQFTPRISLATYIAYLKRVIDQFNIDNEKFIYVPNPIRETPENISKIVEALGCKSDARLIPVETKVATYNRLPRLCITPSSTAIVNVSLLTDNKIDCYAAWHPEFDSFKFLVDWRRDIESDKRIKVEIVPIEGAPSFFNLDLSEAPQKPMFKSFNAWEYQLKLLPFLAISELPLRFVF